MECCCNWCIHQHHLNLLLVSFQKAHHNTISCRFEYCHRQKNYLHHLQQINNTEIERSNIYFRHQHYHINNKFCLNMFRPIKCSFHNRMLNMLERSNIHPNMFRRYTQHNNHIYNYTFKMFCYSKIFYVCYFTMCCFPF